MSGKQLPPEFYQLMEELQQVDFVIVELNLYLNTHPNDYKAVAQFNEFSQKSKILRDKIESKFGPLQNFGNSFSGYPWQWAEEPWPWQL